MQIDHKKVNTLKSFFGVKLRGNETFDELLQIEKDNQERMQADLTMIKKTLLGPDDGTIARVNKNTDFRNTTRKVLWSIWVALIGIIGKIIFWD